MVGLYIFTENGRWVYIEIVLVTNVGGTFTFGVFGGLCIGFFGTFGVYGFGT